MWTLWLGLAAVLAAFVLAGGDAMLAHQGLSAKAHMAGQFFTIPLAASVRPLGPDSAARKEGRGFFR